MFIVVFFYTVFGISMMPFYVCKYTAELELEKRFI